MNQLLRRTMAMFGMLSILFLFFSALPAGSCASWGDSSLIEPGASSLGGTNLYYTPQVGLDSSGDGFAAINDYIVQYHDGTWGDGQSLGVKDGRHLRVAMDENGNELAIWLKTTGTASGGYAIHKVCSKYYSNGAWGEEQTISSGFMVYRPQLFMSGSGNAIAVWYQQNVEWASPYVYAAIFTAGHWGPAQCLSSAGSVYPQGAINDNGQAVVVWDYEPGQQNDYNYVYGNVYSNGGWSGERRIQPGNNNIRNPLVAIDNGGNIIAVWQESAGNNVQMSYVKTSTYTAGSWGAVTQIGSVSVPGDEGDPLRISMNGGGQAVVAWSLSNGIYANLFTNGAWSAPTTLGPGTSGLSAGIDGLGRSVVVWSYGNSLYSRSFENGAWTDSNTAFSGPSEPYAPNLAINARGDCLMVWNQRTGESTYDLWSNVCTYNHPNVSIVSPSDDSYSATSTVTLRWTSDSNIGISSTEVSTDDANWSTVSGNSCIFSSLNNGPHTFFVRVTDNAGNTATASVKVLVDYVVPTIAIMSPADGSYNDTGTVTAEWTGSDNDSGIAGYQYRLDEGAWSTNGSALSLDLIGLVDGAHTLYVRAWDEASNSAIATAQFTVDTVAPDLSILSPGDGAYINTGNLAVSWQGSDASGIDHYRVRLDTNTWVQLASSVNTYTYSGLAQGSHTITVEAVDLAGNSEVVSAAFTVDTALPSVTIVSPTNGARLTTSTVTVQWTASDSNSGLAYSMVRLDGAAWIQVVGSSYDLTGVSDGSHTVTIRATDLAGNSMDSSVTFSVDALPPVVTFTSPSDGAFLNTKAVAVRWIASDLGSSVVSVQVSLDGRASANLPPTATSFSFKGLAEGSHTVTIRVDDVSGHVGIYSLTFTVDTSPPSLKVTCLVNSDNGASTVTALWTARDGGSGIAYYMVSLDNGAVVQVPSGTTSYTFTGLSAGSHILKVVAVDEAGNMKTVTVKLAIKR